MRPSDSALQCHVGRPPQGDNKNANDERSDEQFSGDDLANELSRLNISSLPSSPPYASTRETGIYTEISPDYPALCTSQNFGPLNAGPEALRDATGSSSAVVIEPTTKRTAYGRERDVKYQGIQAERDQFGPLPDLVNVIYGGITTRKGNKRLARLEMSDSGRWRIVRYSRPPGAFPL